MEGGRFKIKPEIYLDLSLDGKPCERVVLQENSTATHANIALRDLSVYEDEKRDKPDDLLVVNFFYSSSRLLLPTQKVSYHDPGHLKRAKVYLRPVGARLNSFSVLFTHMQFLNRSYPVRGCAKQGMETLEKIYRSTWPIKIEITGCGEIPQDDLVKEPFMCYPVYGDGQRGEIGPHIRMCYPYLRYLGMEGMGPPLLRHIPPIGYGETPELTMHPSMYTCDQGASTSAPRQRPRRDDRADHRG